MRKFSGVLLGIFLSLGFFIAPPSYACACGIATFSSENTLVESDGTARAFLAYVPGSEWYVIDPGLRGTAENFGMAAAFPSRPDIQKAPENLFEQLFEYTKPLPSPLAETGYAGLSMGATATAPQQAVTVVEVKQVGDFTVSVLTAQDSQALLQWLHDHDYKARDSDLENFDYYVQRGGYYFVALKLTVQNGSPEKNEYKLTPIEFHFSTSTPFVPLRLVKGTTEHQIKFSLYTVSSQPLIVKGAGFAYSNILPEILPPDLTSLSRYDAEKKWLLKLNMLLDPTQIQQDLEPQQWNQPSVIQLREGDVPSNLFIQETQTQSGVMRVEDAHDLLFYDVKSRPTYASAYTNETFFEHYGWSLIFLFLLLLYLYKAAALFSLGEKLKTPHRWLAWIPLLNIFYFFHLAKKPRRINAFLAPIVAYLVLVLIFNYLKDLMPYYELTYSLLGYITLIVLLIEYSLFERTLGAIALLRGRPEWWGACSILVPPVGLVFLGILAWSNNQNDLSSPDTIPPLKPSLAPLPQQPSLPEENITPHKKRTVKKKVGKTKKSF